MKKGKNLLRLLIFLPIILFSQETFLLPDDADHLLDNINTQIQEARQEVLIFTPLLDDYMLIKHLKNTAKRDIPVTIITQGPIVKENKILRLSLFNNISIFALRPFNNSKRLEGSLICIDNQKLFLLSEDLNSSMMKKRYSFSLYKEGSCNTIFNTLLRRCNIY